MKYKTIFIILLIMLNEFKSIPAVHKIVLSGNYVIRLAVKIDTIVGLEILLEVLEIVMIVLT